MSNATISKNGQTEHSNVETTPRPELADAFKATDTVKVSKAKKERKAKTTPANVVLPTLSARERCIAAAKKFAVTGRQPMLNEDAGDVANPKFRGDAQPRKNWAAVALKGIKLGVLTIDTTVEKATCDILDSQQGSLKLMEKGSVSISASAQRNVVFGKEATECLAGEFYLQCIKE